METIVGVEGNDEANLVDMPVVNTSSTSSVPREIADPVVYKLVRVDGDGRLVPATDDEVMQVEGLLEDDKSAIYIVADTGQNVGCASNDGFRTNKTQFDDSEGPPENPGVDVEMENYQLDTGVELCKPKAEPEESVTLFTTKSDDIHIDPPGTVGECSNPLGSRNESSVSAVCANSMPDFSKLKGEICLDNLSVRELHETFKATFGRETSVKDKQWLKRRISMGLTNSCDFSTTTFVIKDNKVIKKCKQVIETVNGDLAGVSVVEAVNEICGGSAISCNVQIENPRNLSGERMGNYSLKQDGTAEDQQTEQRAAKRLRKPTRRYIEELSEVESKECIGKLIPSVQSSGYGLSSPISHVRTVRDTQLNGRLVVTRQDSFGGSGVEVPYVYRIRRSRPRESFVTLMKLQPSSMGMASKLVKKALGARGARSGNQIGNKVFKARTVSGWIPKPLATEPDQEKYYPEIKESEFEKDAELKHVDSSVGYLDDYIVSSLATEKCVLRRKHHRPWSLSEVIKLVDGVSRYGVGRWSEIKRLAFAAYSYRTSVDLKDKWRNLLRATVAQSPEDNGMHNSRKHASVPIPARILLRVRELSEIQSQDSSPNLSSSKFGAYISRNNVHETRSGYL